MLNSASARTYGGSPFVPELLLPQNWVSVTRRTELMFFLHYDLASDIFHKQRTYDGKIGKLHPSY
jgi:hypothetical protein